MILYIFGQDGFCSRKYLRETVEQFKQKRDPQGYNVSEVDALKDPNKILAELKTAPFLADKRMVVVKNFLSAKDDKVLKDVFDFIKNKGEAEDVIVVFYQDEKPRKTKAVKEVETFLKKGKYSREFNLLKSFELENWIKSETKNRQGKIAPTAVKYLAENAGQDMWLLDSLLDQLINYKDGEEIGLEDVKIFLDERESDDAFQMVEAMMAKNPRKAFRILEEQRKKEVDDLKTIGLIAWQLRVLLRMKDCSEREKNINSQEMAKILGLHPFSVRKNLSIVGRHSLEDLKNIYQRLSEVDLKTKTGQGDRSLLLDLFVSKI